MAVQEGPATRGQRGLKTKWPIEEGLIFGTNRQVGDPILHPEGLEGGSTNVPSRNRKGL